MQSLRIATAARLRAPATGCLAGLALLVAGGCRPEPPAGGIRFEPLGAGDRASEPPAFRRLGAEESGVDFENGFEWGHPLEHLYPHGYAGGGVCVGDYDGDGWPDLFFTSQTGVDRLYRQVAPLRFEDVTGAAGLDAPVAWATGAAFADVDGDGDLDLLVCNYDAPNRLYVNRGDGTFHEAAAAAGLDFRGASVMGAFADYDLDGDLDLYLVTNRLYPGPGLDEPRTTQVEGQVVVEAGFEERFAIQEREANGRTEKYVVKAGQRDRLYRNEGGGRFAEVAAAAGIGGNHPGLSATWWDFDRDGLPDLYVGNDFWDPDRLYHNQGDGTFRDVAPTALPHTPWFSMGADFGDVDNDLEMDFLAADMSATSHYWSKIMMGDMNDSRWFLESAEPRQYMRNALYRGTGTGRFMEIAHLAGVASTDWTWSVRLCDLDNDGWLDLFATNGTANHSFDPDLTLRMRAVEERFRAEGRGDPAALRAEQWALYREVPPRRERNACLRNLGGLEFEDASADWGLDEESIGFGAACVDLDRDGDLDVVVSNVGDPVSIFENRGGGRAILVRLEGRASNAHGIGAEVEVESASGIQLRQMFTTRGYLSAGEPVLHFGLGEDQAIVALRVRWPSGHVQTFRGDDTLTAHGTHADLRAGRLYVITEPEGPAPARVGRDLAPDYEEVALALGLDTGTLIERPFDDFEHQPLLPARLSLSGPGLAWGDADGDGDDDLYVGGPRGTTGQLFLNLGGGRFRRAADGPWSEDRGCEDTAPLWLDVDGDGDQDLYVGSGSNEWAEGNPFLRDRLYLAQGGGRFARAPADHLPVAGDSTSCVVAADFDGDGDLDLFCGARSIPRRYPETPRSRLLVNEGGRFVDATADLAPGLERVGLVTGALWSDADGDGRPDLLVTLEWGPVAFFHNAGGRLVERTREVGLAERRGWWNGIAGADVDGDGDLDYAVTNAGLNTKYHASFDEPALLYYGRFEAGGPLRLVEAKPGDANPGGPGRLPVRGRSCSSDAMPFVGERMRSYHDFATATLTEIYPPERLGEALELSATELASGVLIQEPGEGGLPRFRFVPLPRLAQAAPGYGVALTDFNGDGRTDLYLVQNSFSREAETGRWDGGLSLLLLGDGAGGFTPGRAAWTGLVVPGDATALTTCDLAGDGRPEVVVARNGARLLAFRRADGEGVRVGGEWRSLALRLSGAPGNPTAVGARVTLEQPGSPSQTAEVHAGSGHLSQSAPTLFFGLRGGGDGATLVVRWPDGALSRQVVAAGTATLSVERPRK